MMAVVAVFSYNQEISEINRGEDSEYIPPQMNTQFSINPLIQQEI